MAKWATKSQVQRIKIQKSAVITTAEATTIIIITTKL
jgi:hypothetical protein